MGRPEQGSRESISDGADEVRCWSGPVRTGMSLRTSERRQVWESSLEWLAKLRGIREKLSGKVVPRAELWPELDTADTAF